MIAYLVIFIIILVIVSVILIFYHPLSLWREKILFKKDVSKKIYNIAKNNDFYLLNHIALKIGNKVIHFDHLLFGNKYIYCIGKNYYSYAIDGKIVDEEWFQYKPNGKYEFIHNPMYLHKKRVSIFASLVTANNQIFNAIVVVNNSCLLNKPLLGEDDFTQILNLKDLEQFIVNKEKEDVPNLNPHVLERLVLDIHKKNVND